ncbi:zinc-dependent metalloprotease [Flagellimonas okinawensis]|uniref:Zinc-dependent metalloprotease n=1 Tax=Flagellimonas okinawensis TaxID=3031324 RepID=A0ABT5XTB4_9FLAO|nr:zinc-dependent metalloprotease [[Muricauda] okinawensis]MDF0709055.1 zinc-dependent metalloprotease [[Muricauda] okinawensis]
MKYFFWIWVMCTLPYCGVCQSNDGRSGIGKGDTTAPFLNADMEEDRLYIELPESSLGKPILLTRIGRLTRYETKQVVFRKSGGLMYLEEPRIWSETGIWLPVQDDPKLERNVLGVFPIVEADVNGYRFDITDMLFDRSLGWEVLNDEPPVPSLAKVIGTKQLGDEVMVKIQMGRQMDRAKILQPVHYSFMKLTKPMEPRRFDYRMSYWIESRSPGRNHTKDEVGSIARRRLEKKYKDRKMSVPIRPITLTLSPDIPKKWRPYVKAGIEEWLPAFESAGFKDAIVVKEVDSLDSWSKYSLGNSMVRWMGNGNIRRFGEKPSGSTVNYVVDQRSGEIIKSDVLLRTSYEHLMDEYFVRCAALDERARSYPFTDELLGELLQSLVAHETGHSLGITDNNFGEYRYPVERMGDANWLESMGHTPSIMNYARHNNLAQPEDRVPPSLLIQKTGPTDAYYIRWAYQEFAADMPSEERADSLEAIIRLQDTVPWYRFTYNRWDYMGPVSTDEVVESDNPIQGARLALRNLEQAIALLPMINRGKKDNVLMERLHRKGIKLWYHIMKNVNSLIGGYEIFYKAMDQPGKMYEPIPLAIQQEAMEFLLDQIFDPPAWLAHPSFLTNSKLTVYPDHLLLNQESLIKEMFGPRFLKRLQYMGTLQGFEGVMKNYFGQFQAELFTELNDEVAVGPRKQGLQSTYIDWLIGAIEREPSDISNSSRSFVHTDYTKGIMVGQLMELKNQLGEKLSKDKDLRDKGHWKRCLSKLDRAFGP